MRPPVVIGVNIGHDGGCALVADRQVRVAISEERLNRHRYGSGWWASLQYCLAATNIDLDQVDLFVISSGGPNLPEGFHGGLATYGVDSRRVAIADHHLSHAIGSFCMSGFDDAAVLVCDAMGNSSDTETYFVASRNSIVRAGGNDRSRPVWKGIGFTYEAFTNLLGFSDQESGKTMALAAYGDADLVSVPLFSLSEHEVASELEEGHQWGPAHFLGRCGVRIDGLLTDHHSKLAQDVAAYVQRHTETALVHLVTEVLRYTGQANLCLSGGVALNCVANTHIRETFPEIAVFFPPPASDTGQALGNALYGHWKLAGELIDMSKEGCFLGRDYGDSEILRALKRLPDATAYGRLPRWKFEYHRESDIAAVAASLLAEGRIIGWFQGGSEIGPRALGHRSILADPRRRETRDIVNERIKHREWFRPFAPSILRGEVARFLGYSVDLPFMLESPNIMTTAQGDLPAALHVDGSARVQTVNSSDPQFERLLSKFHSITGVPALLNTSFNDREPIVETPGDALACFLSGDLDHLILGDYLVNKVLG